MITVSSDSPARAPRSRWLVPALAIGFALAMAMLARGYLEADEITHLLCAQAVWHDWGHLVNIWGRLGATGLYALAAPLGPVGPRMLAAGVTALTGWGTNRLLRHFLPESRGGHFRRHATAYAWLLLLAQPCFLLHTSTVMTEMLLACTWVWALVALCSRRVLLAGALLGLGGLMRPEGWIAVAVWPVLLLLWRGGQTRRPALREMIQISLSTGLALLPMAGWYLLGVVVWHDWRWLAQAWPWSPVSQYGRSGVMFLGAALIALAVWMWVPVAAGAWACWKNRASSGDGLHVLVLPAAGFFALHGTLGVLGLFGSMSLPRYFIAVAPLLAVLAVVGLMHMDSRRGGWLRGAVITLALAPLAVLVALRYLPMPLTVEQAQLEVIVRALRARGINGGDGLIVWQPYVALRLGLNPGAPTQVRVFSRAALARAPAGTLLIGDTTLWFTEGRPGSAELKKWGYREDPDVAAAVDAVPVRFEALTLKAPAAAGEHVRLWVKE